MQYYIPNFTSQYFTAGKLYPVLDYIDIAGGILTTDDENKEHYLSADFLLQNFREATDAQIKLLQKQGRI